MLGKLNIYTLSTITWSKQKHIKKNNNNINIAK